MYQKNQRLIPEEDGLLSGSPSPENLLALGTALSAASREILIGAEGDTPFPLAAANLLSGAIAATGANVTLIPNLTLPELSAASVVTGLPLMVHIAEHRLRVYGTGLLPLTQAQQDALFSAQTCKPLAPSLYGEIRNGSGLSSRYLPTLEARLPKRLTVLPTVATGSPSLHKLMTRVLRSGSGKLLTLQLSTDGRRLSVYSPDCGWIFHERLLLLVCQQYLASGTDVALPYWVPHAAEALASRYGRKILRYASCSDGSDESARTLALKQGFSLDATILCVELVRLLSEHGMSLKEWLSLLPDCHTVRRIIRLPDSSGCEESESPLRKWQAVSRATRTAEGYCTEESRGRALLRPSRSGRTATLLTEAHSMEAAAELAGEITAYLEHEGRF